MPARSLTRAARIGVPMMLAAPALALSACSAPVTVQPAADAANPACAPLMLALPDRLGDASLRKTTSQATAAWGDPAAVVLRCGVASPGPTTDRCVSVNGVDWVIRETGSASAPASAGASAPSAGAPPTSAAPATRAPSAAGSDPASADNGTGTGTYTLTTFGAGQRLSCCWTRAGSARRRCSRASPPPCRRSPRRSTAWARKTSRSCRRTADGTGDAHVARSPGPSR